MVSRGEYPNERVISRISIELKMIKSQYSTSNNFEIIRPAEVVYSLLDGTETSLRSNSSTLMRDDDEMQLNALEMSREINSSIATSHYDGI